MKVTKRQNERYGYDYDMFLDRISANLRLLRSNSGFTLRELAREIGCGTSNVFDWESGYVIPSTKNLYILSRIYGVSMDDLCTKYL